MRFETPAGRQAQVDFAEFQFPWGKRYALLVVLGYSRVLWCRFGARQDMRTLITGLEDAFLAFGGVPQELLLDQMKAVITRDLRLQGGALMRNLEFLRFAHHWGFTPRACRPYRAKTKGKVERPVRYVRENPVYGRTFLNDADLAQQCADWLERVANARCHGTVQEAPRARIERDERHALLPLPAHRYASLVLDAPAAPRPTARRVSPVVSVEKRALTAYARSRAVAHEDGPALTTRPAPPNACRLALAWRPGGARHDPARHRRGGGRGDGARCDRAAADRADSAAQ